MESPTLPKDVSKQESEKAILEYRTLLGDENVLVDVDKLAFYEEKLLPESAAKHQAAGALRASSVEQVQKIASNRRVE